MIAEAFVAACEAELAAPKPGNVHVFADDHRMTVEDFRRSAEAAAGPLCQYNASVGRRIGEAVEATAKAVGMNTNLGIILLCAPLAKAAEALNRVELAGPQMGQRSFVFSPRQRGKEGDPSRLRDGEDEGHPAASTSDRSGSRPGAPLLPHGATNDHCKTELSLLRAMGPLPLPAAAGRGRNARQFVGEPAPFHLGSLHGALAEVLHDLSREDAEAGFAAIARAAPAGLGEAARHDVHGPADCDLRQAMAAAADRDRIARAYVTDFEDVFAVGLPALAAARCGSRPDWWPAAAVYLGFLRAFPDSHIARKHGPSAAKRVMLEARACAAAPDLQELLAFDLSLKSRGLNPGTSADLTVATLFAARLSNVLRQGPDNG